MDSSAHDRGKQPVPPQEAAGNAGWVKPEVEIVDIRETLTVGLGNNDGAASHT